MNYYSTFYFLFFFNNKGIEKHGAFRAFRHREKNIVFVNPNQNYRDQYWE